MNKFIVIILILLFQSCTNNRNGNSDYVNNGSNGGAIVANLTDSIEIQIKPEGQDQDNLTICIYNPTSDTIGLHQTYYIKNKSIKDSIIVIGRNSEIPALLFPHKNVTFKVNLGLDSVEYQKDDFYNLIINGKSGKRNFLFYKVLRLGNRYKMNGKTILEPDTVILPVSYIDSCQ